MPPKIKTVTRFSYALKLFTAGGQEEGIQEEKLAAVVHHDENGNTIHEIRYNDDGEIEEEKKLTYNKEGKIISEQLVMPLDGVEEIIKRNYDERNRLTCRTKFYAGDEGEKSNYEYGDHDQPLRSVHYDADGELEQQEEYSYDEKQNIIQLNRKDGAGKVTETHIFVYDDKGNMIEEKETDRDAKRISTVAYEYSETNKPVKMIHSSAEGKLIESFVAAYDEKDLLIERKVRGSQPGIFKYVYDDRGNCTEETITDGFGIPLSKSNYEFDENNILLSDVHYRFDPSRGNRDANYGNRYQYEFY